MDKKTQLGTMDPERFGLPTGTVTPTSMPSATPPA